MSSATNQDVGVAKKKVKMCSGREVYERMNFLYQASAMMSSTNPQLSAYYGRMMKSIGKKAVLRIEPAIKRTLCVHCGVLLNPGFTADLEDFRHKKVRYLGVTCRLCDHTKRFYHNEHHQLWLDNPASVVDTTVFS